ncbi:unnamed protein product [Parnassius mnemosyne]|uniref:Uncharacterized protein n=1 Tax=Parnassius mnemosyne TaxID=213953 RepID=A0AAV1M7X3_9NEOP
MEDLQANQQQMVSGMEQLLSNFKKDGADRRTAAHIKKRLETLDTYWQEFHNLHLQVRELCDENHSYIVQNQYGQVLDFYTKTKDYIQSFLPTEDKSRPSTPIIKPSNFNPPPSTSSATPLQVDRSINSKLDEMLRKQSSNFRAFKRTLANIDLDLLTDNWESEDALKTLSVRWNRIDSLHWELDSELEGTNVAYEQEFSVHERSFSDIKKAINKKIWSTAHQEQFTPKLDIPIFNGNYHQWVPFKDLFTECIHNNRSLSSAQKMQFLKSKVRGEAERLIQHLQISSDNYIICWDILNNRYNNPKLIFTSHMNILMSLPVPHQASVTNIKKIHDTTQECLNAIKNLGIDISTWDPIIVYLLTQKLDNETHHDYVQSLKCPRELPKLQEFLKFLEQTFTSMESGRRKQDNTHQKSHIPSNQNQYPKTSKSNYFKQSYASNRVTTQHPSNISSRGSASPNL